MLEKSLVEKKSRILKTWFDIIIDTYPGDTQTFLKSQKNRFANPVGQTIFEGLEGLYDEIIHGMDPQKVSGFLDQVIRIRAIQDFRPAEAVRFVLQLKDVIRDELKSGLKSTGAYEELRVFESKIDHTALIAFDVYMVCREKIYELKANEFKARTAGLLRKTGYLYELEGEE